MMKRSGFTLIELLIVVAVIGILASITVANVLDAKVKAQVAQVKSDMRSLATAIEMYRMDNGTVLITDGPFSPTYFERLRPLTSPIAYMNALPSDPFQPMQNHFFASEDEAHRWENQMYIYNRGDAANGASKGDGDLSFEFAWSMTSVGPDQRLLFPYYFFPPKFNLPDWYVYDTSNGLVSGGEIFHRSVNAKRH